MPRVRSTAPKRSANASSFFVHPAVAAKYTTRPQQADTLIRVPSLGFRGLLSRITPEVAEHLASNTNLLVVV